MPRAIKRTLATFDFETDPFKNGRVPKPYAVGVYDGKTYWQAWGADCVGLFIDYLCSREPLLLYAHNGGKFDFYLVLHHLRNPIRYINGRIVSAAIAKQRVRDSFAILPVALSATGAKMQIDYTRMEAGVREQHKAEISAYLKQDCKALFNLVTKFRDAHGDKLTIGGAAITALEKFHPFTRLGQSHDEKFRPYYFGGRVECIKQGVHVAPGRDDWMLCDVNSMYPYVMKHFLHPMEKEYDIRYAISRELLDSDTPFFAIVDATSLGAFPFRSEDQKTPLAYAHKTARYHITGHELRAALKLRLCTIHNVVACYVARQAQNFAAFVDYYVAQKQQAERAGDKIGRMIAKLILNSAYGKFGSNPANYKDTLIWRDGDGYMPKDWDVQSIIAENELVVFSRPASRAWNSYYDVATAASITGAARAVMLYALHTVKAPIYCDTDSIICQHPGRLRMHASDLGAWKLEASAHKLALGGRKMYAMFDREGVAVKYACKGVNLTPHEILAIAQGSAVTSRKDAPTFSLLRPNGAFVQRTINGVIKNA